MSTGSVQTRVGRAGGWPRVALVVAAALVVALAAPNGAAASYEFVAKWGSLGSGDGQFGGGAFSPRAHGIATDADGNVYVADTGNSRIQKFTAGGTFISKWGSPGSGDGQFNFPFGIATDADGNVYVADTGNGRIQKFTAGGSFISKWGSPGSGDGQFNNPRYIATDADGNVYVADTGNNRIQKFARTAPALSTQASSDVTLGSGTLSDIATLSGGDSPAGTITFSLYGPDDADCGQAPVFGGEVTVDAGNADYTSAEFTPTVAGTYRWIASYSGDANNAPVAGACNDANETVTVAKATPTLTTQASPKTKTGEPIWDTATLAVAYNPTGEITFYLYGPGDKDCSRPPIFSDVAGVMGNSTYASDEFEPQDSGTYRWRAEYTGDANNEPVISACNEPGESVVVESDHHGGPPPPPAEEVPGPGETPETPEAPVPTCKGQTATIVAVPGSPTAATAGNDVIVGSETADQIFAGAGNDIVCGGDGDDQVQGGPGADDLNGGLGRDELRGNKGRDDLTGEQGSDLLKGGRGEDNLDANDGHDELFGGKQADELAGGKGNDELNGGQGPDLCFGGPGKNSFSSCG